MEPRPDRGISVDATGCEDDNLCWSGAVLVTVGAAEGWADLVARAVASEWTGVELLARLEGTVGEVVVRAGAAHGQQVADVVWQVRTWDTLTGSQRTFAMADCGFGQGRSLFSPGEDGTSRYVVLGVTFVFREGTLGAPVTDPRLADLLGVAPGARVGLEETRDAVLRA